MEDAGKNDHLNYILVIFMHLLEDNVLPLSC